MSSFEITIRFSSDNDWFQSAHQPDAVAADSALARVNCGLARGETEGAMLDGNGNTFGNWEIIEWES